MNSKKERIFRSDISEFLISLDKLSNTYSLRTIRSEFNGHILNSVVERNATRLYSHYEDWTTISTDLKYLEMMKEHITDYFKVNEFVLHSNCKQFITEQKEINGMMYYTYKILSYAKKID